MRYKAYIFDLDDTLYCEHDYVRSGFKAVAAYLHERYAVGNVEVEEIYHRFVQVWETKGRGKVFDQVCEQLKLNVHIQELVQVYREHVPDIRLYADARECLDYLKKSEILLALITDGHQLAQRKKIKALGLERWMNQIIVTDELGREAWKPSPIPYQKAVELLKVDFRECVYIGDNPHKDFITARKLGMATVRIIRPVGDHMQVNLSEEYEADYIIHSLMELMD